MQLESLQARLQDIYEVDSAYNVAEFVFSDRALAEALDTSRLARNIPEKLLIREHPGGLDISLYLDSQLLETLHRDNPQHRLHAGNLAAFCTVVEGISHFVYVIWNACHDRAVTLFELELQAEVDKYIMAAALLAEQSGGELPANLHQALFDKPAYDPQLTAHEQQRYTEANRFARHYCARLHQRLVELGDSASITREIRRFYRLLHRDKIERINCLPARLN